MQITLRPYQIEGIARIRDAFRTGARAPLYVLPTGGGKTLTFSAIAESSEKRGKRVMIVAHRVELIEQIVESLGKFNITPEVIAAGYKNAPSVNRHIAVASAQTLVGRLNKCVPPTLLIVDECHHTAGNNTWATIIKYWHDIRVLGVTATPIRLDGRGLSNHFDRLIVGPSVAELMAAGHLVRARVFQPPTVDTTGLHVRGGEYRQDEATALMNTPAITGDVLQHYQIHGNNAPALVFCTSVQHAQSVADRFRVEGIPAISLNGGTHRDVRRMAVQDFRDGRIKILASCDLFSEGFDAPGAHVGILLRPTMSEALFRQQIGRILRPAPGKDRAVILDHVNNTSKFGLPDEPREWTLTDDEEKRKKKPAPNKTCPKCFAANSPRSTCCDECGHRFDVSSVRNIKEVSGDLIEVTPEDMARRRERQKKGRLDYHGLIAKGRAQGMKNPEGWARHVVEAREKKKLRQPVKPQACDKNTVKLP